MSGFLSDVASVPAQVGQAIASSDILSTLAAQLGVPVWLLSLQQAKWRGIPFFVEQSTFSNVERRTVTHEYPYRDAWSLEDLGMSVQRVTLACFFNSQYATCYSQRKTMTAALLTQTGFGELIHPSAGSRQAWLERSSFNESKEYGGVVRFEITFILQPPNPPASSTDTQAALGTQAQQGIGSSISGFLNSVGTTISGALSSIGISSISSLFSTVNTVLSDAAIVQGVFNNIDTYLGGQQTVGIYENGQLAVANPYFNSVDTTQPYSVQAQQCVSFAISNSVIQKADTLVQFNDLTAIVLTDTSPNDVANAITTAISNITNSIINPLDQTRLLAQAYTNLGNSSDPFTSLMRQVILANMLTSVQSTTLQSQQDASNLQTSLVPLFDNEISIVGSNETGDLTAFMGVRAMKAALVLDLQTRGINLPEIVTITRATALPSFVLAYQLYADATRADEITIRNNPVHPAFIPSPVQALSY